MRRPSLSTRAGPHTKHIGNGWLLSSYGDRRTASWALEKLTIGISGTWRQQGNLRVPVDVGGKEPASITAISRLWRTAETFLDLDGFHRWLIGPVSLDPQHDPSLRTAVRNSAHRFGGVLEGKHSINVRAQFALADPCHDSLGRATRVVRKAFFPGTDEDADNRIVLEQGQISSPEMESRRWRTRSASAGRSNA